MADMFRSEDAERLLMDKSILFIGDSNIRAIYKDLVWLLQNNSLVPQELLRKKLEDSHVGDLKVKGDKLHRGRDYVEDRSYHHDKGAHSTLVEYSFTTLCYSQNVIEIFNDIKSGDILPDVVIMNSTLWDINRWGPKGIDEFKENMVKLMKLVSSTLSPSCIFLWLTATPVSSEIRSSLLTKEIKFLESVVRYNVLEANNYARQIVGSYGYDVLDMHYYCRMQLSYMVKDGIHFEPLLMRYMTNLVLTHCSLSWNKPLPGNVHNKSLENVKKLAFVRDGFTTYIDEENITNKNRKIPSNKPSPPPFERPSAGKGNNFSKQNQICNQNTLFQKPHSAQSAPRKQVPVKQAPPIPQSQNLAIVRPALNPVVDNGLRPTQSAGTPQNSVPWRPFVSWQNRPTNRPNFSNKRWVNPRFAPYQNNRFRGNLRFQKPRMPFWQ